MDNKREDKALLEFKHTVDDIIQLLRKSTEADTVYMYWVNRARQQFVLETSSTILPNVMFDDRVPFSDYYLDDYKRIDQIVQLKVGEDVSIPNLTHYHDHVPVRFLTLVPFINNDETVAITVIETEFQVNLTDYEDVLSSYKNALINLLNTYLELTDLYEGQKEWLDYDQSLDKISSNMHKAKIIEVMAAGMQRLLPTGGVSIVARGMECWCNIMRSSGAPDHPALGLMVEEKSLAYEALQKGEAILSVHFNQNPKLISSRESKTEGATYAIPILINDRRHAVVLAYDQNPLTFKESTKHQLKNLVRIASLAIQVNLGRVDVSRDILTSEYGSFIPEIWEKTLASQIKRTGKTSETTWFGFVTFANLPELRSRLRLEELKRVQTTIVNLLNPARKGFNGFIGFNSDYIFTVVLTGSDPNIYSKWKASVESQLENPVELIDGQKVTLSLQFGVVEVKPDKGDVHDYITRAKKALSDSMKEGRSKSASNF